MTTLEAAEKTPSAGLSWRLHRHNALRAACARWQVVVDTGTWRPGTNEGRSANGMALSTPWNQVEAGVAAALGLPVSIVREPGVVGGVFDLQGDALTVTAEAMDAVAREATTSALETWLRDCGGG